MVKLSPHEQVPIVARMSHRKATKEVKEKNLLVPGVNKKTIAIAVVIFLGFISLLLSLQVVLHILAAVVYPAFMSIKVKRS